MIGSIAAVLYAVQALAADPAPLVTVVVTPNPVTEGESVQLRIEVEAVQSSVVFQPTFEAPDFILVGSQPNYGGAPTRKFVSGASVPMQKTYFEYVLSPKRSGALVIRNIKTKVGGKEVSSPDIGVKVYPDNSPDQRQEDDESSNPAAPGYGGAPAVSPLSLPPADIPERFNSDFTVHLALSKKQAFVGEPIVAEYWLYDYGALRQIEIQRWPTFTGFWKEDLEIATRFEFDEVFHENEMMRRAFLGRYALYGLKPGRYSVEKLIVRGQYIASSRSQGIFTTQQIRTGVHGSQDANVEILPLPSEGKPPNFGGAVGQFFLKAEADKTTVQQHTPVTFRLTLQGVGNFQAIDSIKLTLPPDFEVYESNTGSKNIAPIGMQRGLDSFKTFQTTAIPRKAGSFVVPGLEWWYFDPEKRSYQKASTSPIEIMVTENAAGAQGSNTYAQKEQPSAAPSLLRPLKSIDESPAVAWKKWLGLALFGAMAANVWLLASWLRKRARRYLHLAFKDAFAEAKAELAQGKTAQDASWFSHLEEALFSIAGVLLQTNPRGITRMELEGQWRERGLPAPLFNRISLVLDRLDQLRFGSKKNPGSGKDKKAELCKEVESILAEASKAKRA